MARIRLATIASDGTPPTGQVSVYAKTNKLLYLKNDTGAEFELLTNNTPGIGGYQVDYFVISSSEEIAKQVQLSGTPTQPTRTLLDIAGGGGAQIYSLDFTVSGDTLSWNGGRLDGVLSENDEIRVIWF